MSNPPDRYLVVSLGSIGQRHLQNLKRLRPNGEIAALRLQAGTSAPLPEGCIAQFASLGEVAAFRPAAAIVSSPATAHVEVATSLVELGIPVLIEKPLSHDMTGLTQLQAAAERRNVPIMIGYNLRFNPSLVAAREQILGGAIGEVLMVRGEVGQYLPDWRPGADYRAGVSARKALGGGALLELSHELDYLYWFFGLPDRVTCRGGHFSAMEIDVEDVVNLILEYDQPKRLISASMDFLQRTATRSCKFIGTRGTLIWDGLDNSLDIHMAEPEPGSRTIRKPLLDRNDMYLEELRHFLACVESGERPSIDLSQGIEVTAMIAAARDSMQTGRPVRPASSRARA